MNHLGKVNKKQLAQYLDVSLRGLESIERNGALETRLMKRRARLIEKTKEGRNNYYIIEVVQEVEDMTFEEFCDFRHIKKKDKFKMLILSRIDSMEGRSNVITKTSFGDIIEENLYQVSKFEKVLIDEKFMQFDKYEYLAYRDGEPRFVTKGEYKEFWSQHLLLKHTLDLLVLSLREDLMTKEEFRADYTRAIQTLNRKGEMYHKIPVYKKDINYEMIKNKVM